MRGRALGCAPLLLLGLAGPAPGAARATLGGTLSVGLVGLPPPAADGTAAGPTDSPEAASAMALLALPLCRLLPEAVPVLAALGRATSGTVEEVLVTPLAEARFSDGTRLRTRDVAEPIRRLAQSQSPYRSLLAPVAHLAEALEAAAQHPEAPLRLRLQYAWPDLEASLCHPAFTPTRAGAVPAQGLGLYGPAREGRASASSGAPGGPPYPASLRLSTLPGRSALRLLQQGEVQALLGEATGTEGAARLYATYLVYRQGSLPEGALRALLQVDLEALVRTFVPGPAAPLRGLLPEAAEGLPPGVPGQQPPGAASTVRAFSLGYQGATEERAVAERLQVLLHDAGYAVRLVAGTREALARARTSGTLEASLVSVLLPPLPAPALAVVLGLSGDMGLLGRELPLLGAVADGQARGAKASARARELLGRVPLVPLYVRGLRVQLSARLINAHRDAFGLLVLDDAWLVP
jgi:peptide/nickel transport system substrate-binding protein